MILPSLFHSVKESPSEKYDLVKSIVDKNDQNVTIHTIGMGLFADDIFLGKLATSNGGNSLLVSDSVAAKSQVKTSFNLFGLRFTLSPCHGL